MTISSICKLIVFTLTWLAGMSTVLAQTPYRFEAEMSAGMLRASDAGRNGWFIRQQVTAYVRPRLGVSVGIGWGGAANLAPLSTVSA